MKHIILKLINNLSFFDKNVEKMALFGYRDIII